jgi:hypothetical protein
MKAGFHIPTVSSYTVFIKMDLGLVSENYNYYVSMNATIVRLWLHWFRHPLAGFSGCCNLKFGGFYDAVFEVMI